MSDVVEYLRDELRAVVEGRQERLHLDWRQAGELLAVHDHLKAERERLRPLGTVDVQELVDRLLNAAALLYGSHAQIVMDTEEDRDLQQRVLSTARDLVPDIEKRAAITPKEESRG